MGSMVALALLLTEGNTLHWSTIWPMAKADLLLARRDDAKTTERRDTLLATLRVAFSKIGGVLKVSFDCNKECNFTSNLSLLLRARVKLYCEILPSNCPHRLSSSHYNMLNITIIHVLRIVIELVGVIWLPQTHLQGQIASGKGRQCHLHLLIALGARRPLCKSVTVSSALCLSYLPSLSFLSLSFVVSLLLTAVPLSP